MKKLAMFLTLMMAVTTLPSHEARGQTTLGSRPDRSEVFVNLDHPGSTLVTEHRLVSLRPGLNSLSFHWDGVQLEPSSLQLVLPPEQIGLSQKGLRRAPGQTAATWTLLSTVARAVNIGIRYRLQGMQRVVSYRGWVDTGSRALTLHEQQTLFNRSGASFQDAWVGLGYGNWLRMDWSHRETKKLSVYRVEEIPIQKVYRFQGPDESRPSRAGETGLPVIYEIPNTSRTHLGDRPLDGGKIRLFSGRPGRQGSFLGEDRIEPTPVGDTAAVRTGRSRRVTVNRRQVEQKRVNVVRDQDGNVEMYDLEIRVQFRVDNFTGEPAHVRILETIPGEWSLIEASEPVQRPTSDRIRFDVTMDPDSHRVISLFYRRQHLGRTTP